MNQRGFFVCRLLIAFCCFASLLPGQAHAESATAKTDKPLKEWTFLLFLNGHNNLDRFGYLNLNQMEEVGSTDQVNLIAQWASLGQPTRRLYVEKDDDPLAVTSPVLQELGIVDMGSWEELVKFIRWGVENYPAKKYFIALWNHGNGWRLNLPVGGNFRPQDISYDDISHNVITTEQLGMAMQQASEITGEKIELYGSDACLMSMIEVAYEMNGSVKYFAGSQELEPGEGWPYTHFIRRWVSNPYINGAQLGQILTEEYVRAYQGGVYGTQEVTFSVFDVRKLQNLISPLRNLGQQLFQMDRMDLNDLREQIYYTQGYFNTDYRDLKHFSVNLKNSTRYRNLAGLEQVKAGVENAVTSNITTGTYANSYGISIWLPLYATDWNDSGERYKGLKIHRDTGWGNFLERLYGGIP